VLLLHDAIRDKALIYNLLSVYTVLEYSTFAFVLYSITESRRFRKIILFASIPFYIFTVAYYLLSDHSNAFDSLPASIEAIFIVAFSILYLFDQLNKPQVFFIYQEPAFWFVVGFVIYFSGTLFLFIQASNLDRTIRDNFWIITLFSNIAKNILFAIAFSTRKSKSLYNPSGNPFENDILENPYKT